MFVGEVVLSGHRAGVVQTRLVPEDTGLCQDAALKTI